MNFKVGDRVAVYTHRGREVGWVRTTILDPDGCLSVDFQEYSDACHPKQCRRLVKKERIRIWVDLSSSCNGEVKAWTVKARAPVFKDLIEFIEVKK